MKKTYRYFLCLIQIMTVFITTPLSVYAESSVVDEKFDNSYSLSDERELVENVSDNSIDDIANRDEIPSYPEQNEDAYSFQEISDSANVVTVSGMFLQESDISISLLDGSQVCSQSFMEYLSDNSFSFYAGFSVNTSQPYKEISVTITNSTEASHLFYVKSTDALYNGINSDIASNLVEISRDDGKYLCETLGVFLVLNDADIGNNVALLNDSQDISTSVFSLNMSGDLYGAIDSDGTLVVEGDGTILDVMLSDALSSDELERVAGIKFATDSLREICNDWAYYDGNSRLTGELHFPSSLVTIGSRAFRGCSGFTGDLTIPDGVVSIENESFYGCSGFSGKLYLPSSVKSIGNGAFGTCSGLTGEVVLPQDLTEINPYCFYKCSNLTGGLIVPNNVTVIGDGAFGYCSGLSGELVLNSNITAIGSWAFANCSSLKGNIDLPDSCLSIGKETFCNCSSLDGKLNLGSGLQSIGDSAFNNCSKLKGRADFPISITTISKNVFANCSSLEGFSLPGNCIEVGEAAFYNCKNAQGELLLPESIKTLGTQAFGNCAKITGGITIPKGVTSIPSSLFFGCKSLDGNIVFPEGLTSVGAYAFMNCSNLTGDLIFPDSLINIERDAFATCSKLSGELDLNNVTSIGSEAFCNCYGLSGDLNIPKGIVTIPKSAFQNCTGIERLILPESLVKIENNAFSNMIKLNRLYCYGKDMELGTNIFYVSSANKSGLRVYTVSPNLQDYNWVSDNRIVSPMNTFVIGLPQKIQLKPKYESGKDEPIWYTAFNIELSSDFDNGSYGEVIKSSSFTIGSQSGETRNVDVDMKAQSVTQNGTFVVPVVLTAPSPSLKEEFSGIMNFDTILHELLPASK